MIQNSRLRPTSTNGILTALLVVAAAFASAGCGGFAPLSLTDGQATKNAGGGLPPAGAGLQETETPPGSDGWVKEPGFSDEGSIEDGVIRYQATIKIPYGWVYKAASAAVRAGAPIACRAAGSSFEVEDNATAYAAGEVPCGRVRDDGYKRVAQFTVPNFDGTEGPITYHADGASLDVLISRAQNWGTFQEPRLDSKSTETVASSLNFGDDVSVRYEPREDGKSMRLHVCAAMPGFESTIPPFEFKAKAYIWAIVKITLASRLQVTPGSARFDYARSCVSTDVAFPGESFVPQLAVGVEQAPYVSNASFSGLDVKIEDPFLALLDDVMGWFRVSLRQAAISLASDEANRVLDEELESGRWFTRVNGEKAIESMASALNSSIVSSMGKAGLPLSSSELRATLARQCQLLPLLQELGTDFASLCQRALDATQLAVLPFYRDPVQAAAGCYDYYANIHQTGSGDQRKWWSSQCGFSMRLQLTAQTRLNEEEKSALNRAIAELDRIDQLVDEAAQRIGAQGAETAVLAYLLDQARGQGVHVGSLDELLALAPQYQGQIDSLLKSWMTKSDL